MTSRQGGGWQGLARVVRVGELSLEDSGRLLERVIRDGSVGEADLTGASELCERLGRLPVAIDQAGAFIAQNGSSPARYLALLERHGAGLFEHAAVGADPQRTVARIWRTTFDRLGEDPLAVQMLRVLAWLAPTGTRRHTGDPLTHGAALNLLAAYHLVTLLPGSISVYPLVQEISRTPSEGDPYRSGEVIAQARDYATGLLIQVATSVPSVGPRIGQPKGGCSRTSRRWRRTSGPRTTPSRAWSSSAGSA